MKKTSLFAMLLTLVGASAVSAATVTFTLDMSPAGRGGGPGSFQVRARSSSGDNFGIAGYSVDLLADPTVAITSINHSSLRNGATEDSGGNSGPAGFTLLRSPDVAAGATLPGAAINGSQDTIQPTPHLIRGLGQTAGSLAALNLTPLGSKEGDPWEANLVIAQGTFSIPNQNNLEPLGIAATALTIANVFTAASGTATEAATIVTEVIPIPEPATLAMAGLSLLGLVACSRRK